MKFPSLNTPAIIALKGLPVSHKSRTALLVAKWAKSPVLCLEDFLVADASPSMDEAQHLLRQAFDLLCVVAERQARENTVKCVVIKSRLCTTFEVDQLIALMIRSESHALLIIDCQISSEYQRRLHFKEDYIKDEHWYKLKTWNEVEMAGEEYDAQAWDHHFENSIAAIPEDNQRNVRRLVLDVSHDGILSADAKDIGSQFSRVITSLLSGGIMVDQRPSTVLYHDVLRALMERKLNAPRQKSNYICTGTGSPCVFKYHQALEADVYCCRVCEKLISGAAYECYKCKLALHKSCAEEPTMVREPKAIPYLDRHDEMVIGSHFENPYYHFTEKHACEHCEAFSYECVSCLLYTHLKCRLMPTIIKHDCHPEHFLQVNFVFNSGTLSDESNHFTCKGCNCLGYFGVYTCFLCGCDYHARCVAAAKEVKHKHGGYEHVMQLMYSFDGMEKQEEFWCDICHKDMDSTVWFYRCKECPYYVSHMDPRSRLPCKDTGRL